MLHLCSSWFYYYSFNIKMIIFNRVKKNVYLTQTNIACSSGYCLIYRNITGCYCIELHEVWFSMTIGSLRWSPRGLRTCGIRLRWDLARNTVCSSTQLWLSSTWVPFQVNAPWSRYSVSKHLAAELITVLMSSQDVEVTESCRVICRPALEHNHPKHRRTNIY